MLLGSAAAYGLHPEGTTFPRPYAPTWLEDCVPAAFPSVPAPSGLPGCTASPIPLLPVCQSPAQILEILQGKAEL